MLVGRQRFVSKEREFIVDIIVEMEPRGNSNLCAIGENALTNLGQLKLEKGQIVVGWLHNHRAAGIEENPLMLR